VTSLNDELMKSLYGRERGPTIQAFDTDDDTLYVLLRPGLEPVTAHWPQPLEELCPEAKKVRGHMGITRSTFMMSVTVNQRKS